MNKRVIEIKKKKQKKRRKKIDKRNFIDIENLFKKQRKKLKN